MKQLHDKLVIHYANSYVALGMHNATVERADKGKTIVIVGNNTHKFAALVDKQRDKCIT